MKISDISVLKDAILIDVELDDTNDTRVITFRTMDGAVYKMLHQEECCEDVYLEDVCGDFDDIIGSPILSVEAVSSEDDQACEYGEWTFYKIDTNKGGVTLRWYGSSNGYYSTDVKFYAV
jgi:hypothetical protein